MNLTPQPVEMQDLWGLKLVQFEGVYKNRKQKYLMVGNSTKVMKSHCQGPPRTLGEVWIAEGP